VDTLEIVLSKGIRVNQLAKELGVESKQILAKCREEGLGEKVPNHMSVLSIGLTETVREWFSGGGVQTAVETAAPVGVATRPKLARKPVSDRIGTAAPVDDDEHRGANGHATAVAAPAEPREPVHFPTPTAPVAEVPPADAPPEPMTPVPLTPVAEEPVEPAPAAPSPAPVVVAPAAPAPAAPPVVEAPRPPASAPALRPAATAAPAGRSPGVAPVGRPASAPPIGRPLPAAGGPPQAAPAALLNPQGMPADRPLRPTVTLSGRTAPPAMGERKPLPKPVAFVPKPAVIQGPTVVREEAPEHLPPLRRPGVARPGFAGPTDSPTFIQARAKQGGGVIRTEEEDEAKKAAAKKASLSVRRRGLDGRRGEASEKLKEFTEADLIARRDALNAATANRAGVDRHLRAVSSRGQHAVAKTNVQKGEPIYIEEPITLRSLSTALGVKTNDLQKRLIRQKLMVTINQTLDAEVAESLALEFGLELRIAQQATMEELLIEEFAARVPNPEDLVVRAPVVTILGHVDHGKTSLLDRIRNANVAAGEAGGITQHTAAWMVTLGEGDAAKRVTFIDTPGHQAFTSMRARGANMTDVVVLVVSAAEGVQPQTIESINHAKAAGVPIVVAMNKIDRADANPDMVLGQLASHGLNPVEWGGDVEVIRTSATTGQGVNDLIEILDYQSTLLDLKADPTAPARGTVIEASIDEGLGSVATVLVQDGTLRPGDIILTGPGYGRVRSLWNDRGENITEAGPSVPVIVSGLDESPQAGDKLFVLDDFDRARSIAEERSTQSRQTHLSSTAKVTLDNLFDTMKTGDIKTINLIIKGDVQGSVETLAATVTGQNTEEVRVKVIHAAVGGITESDVELADASSAVIIGFSVVPDAAARAMAEQRRVEIRLYNVIYEIFDDLKKALSGMLEPEIREKLHGHAEVRQVFKHSKIGTIAGCYITDGHIQRGSKIRLSRGGIVITEDLAIETLKRVKEDVKEVKTGFECGIKLANYDDVKVGDILEGYIKETIQRTL
jgi:translation initiation factor IF-2